MYRNTLSSFVLLAGLLVANTLSSAQSPVTAKASSSAKPSSVATTSTSAATLQPDWLARSYQYTQTLIDVQLRHSPESASSLGLTQFDTAITDASPADELAQRKQLEEILATLKKTEAKESDKNVQQDLQILRRTYALQFRQNDYQAAHTIQFIDATQFIYLGLSPLLGDHSTAARQAAAVIRMNKYAGIAPGFKPFTDLLKQRLVDQMAKPNIVYPPSDEMEAFLQRNKSYIDALRKRFEQRSPAGWYPSFLKLSSQLADYDTWVRATIMPKTPPIAQHTDEESALSLQSYDIDLPPAQLDDQAHIAFAQIQQQMAPIAADLAKQHNWSSADYRDVLRQLRQSQISGDAILAFYQARLKAIEQIVTANNLATLPNHPAILRLSTADESAQLPAPHMKLPSSLLDPTQSVEFVLPDNPAAPADAAANKSTDFTFDAMAWPMTAHESRPGNELQFDAMRQHGLSKARQLYAFNSTNAEAWGLYCEWLLQPYEPADGQLATLQLRLLRAARAFLVFDLQSGKITQDDAAKLIEDDIVLSHDFAREEAARLANEAPGQAASGFYAYTVMLQLRKETEAALGTNFNARKFHDFILAQGLLPLDLLRTAVFEDFIPAQTKK